MRPVDCVFSIHISHAKESIVTLFNYRNLVDASMRSQNSVLVYVVSICRASRYMIWRYKECVEAIFSFNYRVIILKNFKLLVWNS